MSDFIVSESQFSKIKDSISFQKDFELAQKNWDNFSNEEKKSVVECLTVFYPEKGKLITESTWLNTLGDIIGIFDPTGVVDIVNGISYIYQGDNLFGFLSLVSAVPYLGDVVAKPVMGALKVGAPAAKNLEKVLKLSKAGKTAEAATLLNKLSQTGGITGTFVKGFGRVATKLKGYIERAPMGIFKGLKNTILQWINLFERAALKGTRVRMRGQILSKNLPKLTQAEQLAQLSKLKTLAKNTKVFSSYRTTKGILSWKSLFRGMPQLIGRNASVRALARQTKWWAGFLDYLGLGNFVGPEELVKRVGEDKMIAKMEEYQKTDNAKNNFTDDFGSEINDASNRTSNQTSTSSTATSSSADPIQNILRKLLVGQVNPLPG